MDNNHTPQKDGDAIEASSRVSGMPTIEELRRRVSMRRNKAKKSGSSKKTSQ